MKACSSKVGSWATLYKSALLMLAHYDGSESTLLTTTDGGDDQLPTLLGSRPVSMSTSSRPVKMFILL